MMMIQTPWRLSSVRAQSSRRRLRSDFISLSEPHGAGGPGRTATPDPEAQRRPGLVARTSSRAHCGCQFDLPAHVRGPCASRVLDRRLLADDRRMAAHDADAHHVVLDALQLAAGTRQRGADVRLVADTYQSRWTRRLITHGQWRNHGSEWRTAGAPPVLWPREGAECQNQVRLCRRAVDDVEGLDELCAIPREVSVKELVRIAGSVRIGLDGGQPEVQGRQSDHHFAGSRLTGDVHNRAAGALSAATGHDVATASRAGVTPGLAQAGGDFERAVVQQNPLAGVFVGKRDGRASGDVGDAQQQRAVGEYGLREVTTPRVSPAAAKLIPNGWYAAYSIDPLSDREMAALSPATPAFQYTVKGLPPPGWTFVTSNLRSISDRGAPEALATPTINAAKLITAAAA
jgi:hypothetical protein